VSFKLFGCEVHDDGDQPKLVAAREGATYATVNDTTTNGFYR